MTWQEVLERKREMDRRDRRRRRAIPGPHEKGQCGYWVVCRECYEMEEQFLRSSVPDIPPKPGEEPADYWRRVGGRFLDPWYDVVYERYHRHGVPIPPI
ncbi:MAG: hypothetical protein QN144_14695 [Armatimonadota bacterium]|nr:hypothetical protein [Armatimonadota bacterium]